MFFGKLLPREGNFFEMFNQHAKHVVETSKAFSSLVANYSDPSQREQYMNDVHRAEGAADRITTEVNGRFTPPSSRLSTGNRFMA
jgi:uncharacterized protein Yka (UPF0111/DUF47 family)